MTRRLTIMAVLLALMVGGSTSTVASAADDDADVWFCSTDDATGFKKKSGKWESVKLFELKFKMKFEAHSTSIVISGLSPSNDEMQCKQNYGLQRQTIDKDVASIYKDLFFCTDDMGSYFSFNRANGHYVSAASIGWLVDTATDKTSDTVTIDRGTCTKF
jgi:hypothetical protein